MRTYEQMWTSVDEHVTDLIFRMEQLDESFVGSTWIESEAIHEEAPSGHARSPPQQQPAIENTQTDKKPEPIRNRERTRRPQRSLPLRQRQKIQELPHAKGWRSRVAEGNPKAESIDEMLTSGRVRPDGTRHPVSTPCAAARRTVQAIKMCPYALFAGKDSRASGDDSLDAVYLACCCSPRLALAGLAGLRTGKYRAGATPPNSLAWCRARHVRRPVRLAPCRQRRRSESAGPAAWPRSAAQWPDWECVVSTTTLHRHGPGTNADSPA